MSRAILDVLDLDGAEAARLLGGDHSEPHRILGAHPASADGREGAVVRAMHVDAAGADCVLEYGTVVAMTRAPAGGLFAAFLPDARPPFRYRVRFRFGDGGTWEREDPYRFLPTLGEVDLHLFNEGTHRRLWECMGAHPRTIDSVAGVAFAVWAPSARRVSVVGEFCGWDGRHFPMRVLGDVIGS